MIEIRRTATRRWILQAYISFSPAHPHWCEVEFTAVGGWQRYRRWESQRCWRDPRLTSAFSRWEFVSAEAGEEVLRELVQHPQKHWLRVIERDVVTVERLVAGQAILPGSAAHPDLDLPVVLRDQIVSPPSGERALAGRAAGRDTITVAMVVFGSAYYEGPGARASTHRWLRKLERMGLASSDGAARPRWSITQSGREAIAQNKT